MEELAVGHGVNSGDLWKLGYEYGEINGSGGVDTTKNTGNVARQTLSFNGLAQPFVQSYKYDSLYRLTEAKETSNSSQTWKQVFDYDRYGNRLTHNQFSGTDPVAQTAITHPSIDPANNRIDSPIYDFDKNGNLVIDGENRRFAFNADNKQREVRDASNNLVGEYFYDGEGKRVKKVTYGTTVHTTVFVYSGGKLAAEYSTEAPPPQPTTNWTVTDMLGSPRVILNSLGEVVSRRDFLPFGEEITPNQNVNFRTAGQKYVGDGVRQKFTGYQKDGETGLDFAEARMYENRHARFTAVDPLLASGKSGNPQTFNRYVYVRNNPTLLTDPTGLQAATNLVPCQQQECEYTRTGKKKFTANFPVAQTDSERADPASTLVSTESALLSTTIALRPLLPLLESTGPAATAGLGASAGTGCLFAAGAACTALLAQRMAAYTQGGFFDNTVSKTQWIDGLPYVRTTGSTNVIPFVTPNLLPNRFYRRQTGPTILPIGPDADSERPNFVAVYRGLNGTNPGAFRFDADGLSTFETQQPGFKFQMGFSVMYRGPKIGGTVGQVIDPEYTTPITATYTPQFGPGHWSLNFPAVSVDEAKMILSQRAKQLFR